MGTDTSHLHAEPVGAFFTPAKWADFCVHRFGIVREWLSGASVCDPTAGVGSFIFSLCDQALAAGRTLSCELLSNLYFIEKEPGYTSEFQDSFLRRYGIPFPYMNIHIRDIILDPPNFRVDILVGNPPWANFSDLPCQYKETLKPYFLSAGLVIDSQDLLLGSSRIDLAALVVTTSMENLLRDHGKAVFILPMSIFQNDGAHAGFRRYFLPGGSPFALREILDFNGQRIFDGVRTRLGVAFLEKNAVTKYPIPYSILDNDTWLEKCATPFPDDTSPLSVHGSDEAPRDFLSEISLDLREEQKPRQGVNTCGANQVFIFETKPDFIPEELLYPLADKSSFHFHEEEAIPNRYIFLPHDPISGKPLEQPVLERSFPTAWRYLQENQESLQNRKGSLITSWKTRGFWWALLGVGPYSFAPYKVIWEAYGSRTFHSEILGRHQGQPWQGNQALHAYIPCRTRLEAEAVKISLSHPSVQEFLEASRTQGTCNWAQPGRIKQIIRFRKPQLDLF
ncbi:MAG TPA: SAM-dependent DNA methyltransferase [bacterium]|nr:SAM-dependent DNA methyltransferase [bacterium]HQL62033.1 SAM-dependent DNA methyltransferase [bacterium]